MNWLDLNSVKRRGPRIGSYRRWRPNCASRPVAPSNSATSSNRISSPVADAALHRHNRVWTTGMTLSSASVNCWFRWRTCARRCANSRTTSPPINKNCYVDWTTRRSSRARCARRRKTTWRATWSLRPRTRDWRRRWRWCSSSTPTPSSREASPAPTSISSGCHRLPPRQYNYRRRNCGKSLASSPCGNCRRCSKWTRTRPTTSPATARRDPCRRPPPLPASPPALPTPGARSVTHFHHIPPLPPSILLLQPKKPARQRDKQTEINCIIDDRVLTCLSRIILILTNNQPKLSILGRHTF